MNKLNQLSQLQLKGGWQLHSIGAHSKFNQSDSLSWKLNNGKGTNQIVVWGDISEYCKSIPKESKKCIPMYYIPNSRYWLKDDYNLTYSGSYESGNRLVKYSDLKITKKKHPGIIRYTIKAPSTYNHGIYAMIWIASPGVSLSSASNLNRFTIGDASSNNGSRIVQQYNTGSGIVQSSGQIEPIDASGGQGEYYSYLGIVNYQDSLAVMPIEKVSVGVRVLWRGTGSYPDFNKYLVKDYFTTSYTITAYENLDLGVIS